MVIFQTPEATQAELEVIQEVETIRKKLGYALQTPKKWNGFLRRNLIAGAIQGSNTIEGYVATFEDAVALVEGESVEGPSEEILAALMGYREALTYIIQLADDQDFAFNQEIVKALHYMMLKYDHTKHPGRWRPGQNFVRKNDTGEIVYEPPEGSQVPQLMQAFVSDVAMGGQNIPIIIKAAMAHLNLVMIHPFSDGNGRMGRAVQTLVLARDGVITPPFWSIEEYLGRRATITEQYYAVLKEVGGNKWDPTRDARPWVRFCLNAHLQEATRLQRRISEIQKIWGEIESELHKRKLPDRMIFAVYDATMGMRVKSARYRVHAELSAQVASRDLGILVREGLLVPQGKKRGTYYVRSAFLRDLRDRLREPKIQVQERLQI